MTDYSGYAMYQQAIRAYGDPEFATWLCELHPWGGVTSAGPDPSTWRHEAQGSRAMLETSTA